MKKFFSMFLLCILIVGVFNSVTSEVVMAVSITQKIPVPAFTVAYKDLSYDVPASTSKDPYTGEAIIIPGYHVDNRTIQVTIDNRELVKNYGEWGRISYEARMKGSYEDEWNGGASSMVDKDSQFTIIIFDSASGSITFPPGSFVYYYNIPFEGKVDIQVRARINGMYYNEGAIPPARTYYEDALIGESDWSKTQTITIKSSYIGGSLTLTSDQSDSQIDETSSGFNLVIRGLLATLCVMVLVISIVFIYTRKFLPKKSTLEFTGNKSGL